MIAAGELIALVQAMVDDRSAECKRDIRDYLNQVYLSEAASRPWSTLIQYVAAQGTILPADLVTFVYVEDNKDYLYFPISRYQQYFSQRLFNYFQNPPPCTPLATGDDMATTMNSVTVTAAGAAFTAAMIGEYVRIGTNSGFYKIAAVPGATTLTLADKFRGADWTAAATPASLTAQHYEIRPTGTKQLALVNEQGDAITTATLKIWYLRRPLPILNDYDAIELPGTCNWIFAGVCKQMLRQTKYNIDALREAPDFDLERAKATNGDPLPEKFVVPRDRFGQRNAYGRIRAYTPQSIHSVRTS